MCVGRDPLHLLSNSPEHLSPQPAQNLLPALHSFRAGFMAHQGPPLRQTAASVALEEKWRVCVLGGGDTGTGCSSLQSQTAFWARATLRATEMHEQAVQGC